MQALCAGSQGTLKEVPEILGASYVSWGRRWGRVLINGTNPKGSGTMTLTPEQAKDRARIALHETRLEGNGAGMMLPTTSIIVLAGTEMGVVALGYTNDDLADECAAVHVANGLETYLFRASELDMPWVERSGS